MADTLNTSAQLQSDILNQETLVLNSDKRNPKLREVYIRPNIHSERISGTLEAHSNGLRFTSVREDKVDILYNNIKHAFFQSGDEVPTILLHFRLKNAIMIGESRSSDVQFYTEVEEITDLEQHQIMRDPVEQAKRELRQKVTATFGKFIGEVEDMTEQKLHFQDIWYKNSFRGVPYHSTITLIRTVFCFVNLTDWPPFIIDLKDIEFVHFERVQSDLDDFDIVFVFKDYQKEVSKVKAVPMGMKGEMKETFNSSRISCTEGPESLNWTQIMKTVTDNPQKFFDNGGWSFLNPLGEGEGHEDDSSEDDSYEPSGSEDDEEDSSEDAYSDPEFSKDSSDIDLGSSDESAKDWTDLEEEMEKKAAKAHGKKDNAFRDEYTSEEESDESEEESNESEEESHESRHEKSPAEEGNGSHGKNAPNSGKRKNDSSIEAPNSKKFRKN